MLKRILTLLIIVCGCLVKVTAHQDSIPDKQISRVMERADEKYKQYSFSPAIDIYKKVLDKGYSSSDLLKKLGNSYYFNAKYQEAADTYKKLEEAYPDEMSVEDVFRYAQSLKSVGDYDQATRVNIRILPLPITRRGSFLLLIEIQEISLDIGILGTQGIFWIYTRSTRIVYPTRT